LSYRVRQLVAYLAIAVTGGASVATSCGGETLHTEGPPQKITLDPANSRTTLRFAIHTNGVPSVRLRVDLRGSPGTTLHVDATSTDRDGGLLQAGLDGGVWTLTGSRDGQETDVCGGREPEADHRCGSTFTVTFEAGFQPGAGPLEVIYTFLASAESENCDTPDPFYIQVDPA
jgi:hypothetical protein